MFHLDEGARGAPVVVLVHGFSSSLHSFDKVATLLARDHRVVRVDLNGHGRTGGDERLDPQRQGEDLTAVLDGLGVSEVTVVGHSFGADVAIAAAASPRVGAVIVVGQAPDYTTATLPRGRTLMTLPVVGRALHRSATAPAVLLIARAAFAPGYNVKAGYDDPRQPILDHRATSVAMYREVIVDRKARMADDPLDAQLRRLGKPALAILGRRDQWYPVGPTSQRYRQAGIDVTIVDGAGHSPNIERPEQTATLVRGFLARVRAAAATSNDGPTASSR